MSQSSIEVKRRYSQSEQGKMKRKLHYQIRIDFYRAYERDRQYRKMYGLTIDHYNSMLADQGGGCKICGATKAGPKRTNLAVDHCHTTGKIRGLLCNKCNVAVGFYEKHHEKVARYLES
jgi:hypothetical protein